MIDKALGDLPVRSDFAVKRLERPTKVVQRPAMDVNCGTILEGEETVPESGQRIFDLILRFASGKRTKSELFDFGSAEFAPWPLGVTV